MSERRGRSDDFAAQMLVADYALLVQRKMAAIACRIVCDDETSTQAEAASAALHGAPPPATIADLVEALLRAGCSLELRCARQVEVRLGPLPPELLESGLERLTRPLAEGVLVSRGQSVPGDGRGVPPWSDEPELEEELSAGGSLAGSTLGEFDFDLGAAERRAGIVPAESPVLTESLVRARQAAVIEELVELFAQEPPDRAFAKEVNAALGALTKVVPMLRDRRRADKDRHHAVVTQQVHDALAELAAALGPDLREHRAVLRIIAGRLLEVAGIDREPPRDGDPDEARDRRVRRRLGPL